MFFLYDLAVLLSWFLLHLAALFSLKIRQFVTGRKKVFSYLKAFRNGDKPLIWIHTASLGEFEQGAPVLDKLRQAFPDHQFLVTFFSPSGYEVKKDRLAPDLVTYLPMDTRWNARKFIRLAQPELALFVKYEVWPGFFRELDKAGIPILLLSAIFRERQIYFKWYGGFLRKALRRVNHFYVQDALSADLLGSLGIHEATVSGDTRFDRVLEILEAPRELPFMDHFKADRTCMVCGSTWPEDHEILLPFINEAEKGHCFVIAPHKTDPKTIEALQKGILKPSALYSERKGADFGEVSVLIIDTIGLLTQIYRYADLAYVGGGFATGLHNTLEPAVFGIPVLIGPRFEGFREAEEMVAAGGVRVARDAMEF
ncbi:MAG: glycosyltransferase N-terminal domain-containing protein, partial [Robiginitalea sp.]|nr:glycosyltransferase N-terminal domain-containing protein [Robiginitalea sp.]